MSYDHRMRRRASDYAAAAVFLILFAIGGLVTTLLSPRESAALRLWASTNVASLQHHPVLALVLSAFLPSGSPLAWLAPIALTMFGANRAVGTARLALICAAGHLIGTGVSEGIVAYRLDHGSLPPAWSHIPDVGPSYVVVSAIVVAVMFGTWLTRVTALAVFAVLVFVSHIFAGLTSLHVTAVGHLTAIVTAAALGLVLAVRQRGVRAGPDGMTPARGHRAQVLTEAVSKVCELANSHRPQSADRRSEAPATKFNESTSPTWPWSRTDSCAGLCQSSGRLRRGRWPGAIGPVGAPFPHEGRDISGRTGHFAARLVSVFPRIMP